MDNRRPGCLAIYLLCAVINRWRSLFQWLPWLNDKILIGFGPTPFIAAGLLAAVTLRRIGNHIATDRLKSRGTAMSP